MRVKLCLSIHIPEYLIARLSTCKRVYIYTGMFPRDGISGISQSKGRGSKHLGSRVLLSRGMAPALRVLYPCCKEIGGALVSAHLQSPSAKPTLVGLGRVSGEKHNGFNSSEVLEGEGVARYSPLWDGSASRPPFLYSKKGISRSPQKSAIATPKNRFNIP